MVEVMLAVPIKAVVGVKADWLVVELLRVDNTDDATDWPFTFQANVIESASVSVAIAVKFIEAGMATTAPVAAGVWVAHTGGVFLVTVQVRVEVLVPLSSLASTELAPALNCDESRLTMAFDSVKALPLIFHETAQDESLGVTANAFEVAPAAAILVVAVDGEVEVKEQSFCTLRFHEQVDESRPSEILAVTVFEPTRATVGAKSAIL